ncbi:MAG: hypothetical protein R3E78_11965 [Burkholderiaceae bacterium]|jgi:HTH-type transcriptional regulator/antitoxin HigA
MIIRPIHTEDDYRAALADISALMESDPAPDTPDGDRLDILATQVQAYESRHFAIDAPEPRA